MRRINLFLGIGMAVLLTACRNGEGDFDASGVFETTEVIVSSEANGKIMKFNLQEGQAVSATEAIGYIDTIQLSLKKQELEAKRQAMLSRRQDVPRQVAALREQIAKLKKEQARFTNLVQQNAANQKQLDDLQAERIVAEKQLAAQMENLNNVNRSLSDEIRSAGLQIAQLEDQLKKSILVVPVNGTVLTKYAEEGELASVGRALFKVGDLKHLYLRAYITASQLTKIKVGQSVKVYGDSGEKERKTYTGMVSWISDQSEFTPKTIQTRDERANLVYAIKIAVTNDGYLKRGMYGEVKFE